MIIEKRAGGVPNEPNHGLGVAPPAADESQRGPFRSAVCAGWLVMAAATAARSLARSAPRAIFSFKDGCQLLCGRRLVFPPADGGGGSTTTKMRWSVRLYLEKSQLNTSQFVCVLCSQMTNIRKSSLKISPRQIFVETTRLQNVTRGSSCCHLNGININDGKLNSLVKTSGNGQSDRVKIKRSGFFCCHSGHWFERHLRECYQM